jgi:hypothetical protein
MPTTKQFKATLSLNWKTGNMKVYKKQGKKKIGLSEIPIEFTIDVIVPDDPKVTAYGKIELGQEKVNSITLDSL